MDAFVGVLPKLAPGWLDGETNPRESWWDVRPILMIAVKAFHCVMDDL